MLEEASAPWCFVERHEVVTNGAVCLVFVAWASGTSPRIVRVLYLGALGPSVLPTSPPFGSSGGWKIIASGLFNGGSDDLPSSSGPHPRTHNFTCL